MERRQLLGLVGAGTTTVLTGCSDLLGNDSSLSERDRNGGNSPIAGIDEWPSVGRTPRNHATHPTAATPRGEEGTDIFSRRWDWRPHRAEGSGDGETNFTGDISGVVADDEYLYTVVSGTLYSDGRTESLNALFAVDPASGETSLQTSFRDGTALGNAIPPTVADDRILLAGRRLQAFRTDGERAWQIEPNQVAAGPPVATDGNVYLPTAGGIECRTLADGSERWTAPVGTVTGSSTVAVADSTVFASLNNHVIALDRDDGTEQWRTGAGAESVAVPDGRTPVGTPIVDDNRVYVAGGLPTAQRGDTAALVALDRTDGTELWRYRPETGVGGNTANVTAVYGLPALVDDRLIAIVRTMGGDPTGQTEFGIVAVDAAEGTQLWGSKLAQTLATSVVATDDTVYAATGGAPADPTENALTAFTVTDGAPAGVGETDGMGRILRGRPAAIVDDAVIVPTRNGLVAFADPAR